MLEGITKYLERQKNKPRVYGVHLAQFKSDPGTSTLRHYVLHNPGFAKFLINEELNCLRLMRARIRLVA